MLLEADCQEKTVELTMPFDDFSDCADKIKAYRKKYKLTQEELAEIIGVNPFTLPRMRAEKCKTAISHMAAT